MRLAFYTYSYTDKLDMPIAACLERIAGTGYSGIDVSGTHGASDDPASFAAPRRRLMRETARRLGLRIEAVITHAQLTDTLTDSRRQPLDLAGSIDLAADLGAPVVTFHMGGYRDATSREKLWRNVVEIIKKASDNGAAKHVALAVDGIWPTWIVDRPAALSRLFDEVDHENFGVNFDPCYLTLMGVDPTGFVGRFRRRIVHGHLKDHVGKYPDWKHRIPGGDDMDYARVFQALEGVKFDGAVAVECFTDMKFDEACDSGYSTMAAAAKKAGVAWNGGRGVGR